MDLNPAIVFSAFAASNFRPDSVFGVPYPKSDTVTLPDGQIVERAIDQEHASYWVMGEHGAWVPVSAEFAAERQAWVAAFVANGFTSDTAPPPIPPAPVVAPLLPPIEIVGAQLDAGWGGYIDNNLPHY